MHPALSTEMIIFTDRFLTRNSATFLHPNPFILFSHKDSSQKVFTHNWRIITTYRNKKPGHYKQDRNIMRCLEHVLWPKRKVGELLGWYLSVYEADNCRHRLHYTTR